MLNVATFLKTAVMNLIVLTDNGLSGPAVQKLNWFLECEKFPVFFGTITKISG